MKGFASSKKEDDNVNLFGGLWEAQAHDDKLVELNTNDSYCFVGDKRSKGSLHKVRIVLILDETVIEHLMNARSFGGREELAT